MKLTGEQRRALELYRDFREEEPGKRKRVQLSIPTHLALMGPLEFIGYRTTHARKSVLYTHEFSPGSRPMLCAGGARGELFIVGDRFHVTERGIVDLDASGREIDDGGGHR